MGGRGSPLLFCVSPIEFRFVFSPLASSDLRQPLNEASTDASWPDHVEKTPSETKTRGRLEWNGARHSSNR